MPFEIVDTTREDFPVVTLRSSDGSISASFATQIGMVGCSLEHDGVELLGQRNGLAGYAEKGSTMGIPLLHPWANRLNGFEYEVAGRRVTLDRGSPLIKLDPNGLPIHGLLAASPHWRVTRRDADEAQASLSTELDFGAHPELLEAFPFPHTIAMTATLSEGALRITTEIRATGDIEVPISFGYHPYLTLPGVPRADWEIELPVTRRLATDDEQIPTGETEPAHLPPNPLGDTTYDDGYCYLTSPTTFVLEGSGRRVELDFLDGYDFAQVYAPPDQDLIAFEPMTAATNALVAGGPGLRCLEPGNVFNAAFEIRAR